MTFSQPPNPSQFRNLLDWARQFYDYTLAQTRVGTKSDPTPILLSHQTTGDERAAVDGIVMYDPTYAVPVIAKNGVWVPLTSYAELIVAYEEAYNVNADDIARGGDAVPLNTTILDNAAWGSFNPTTGYITLEQGSYLITGFVQARRQATPTGRVTGYIAATSDLTTPVGSVIIPTIYTGSVTDGARFRGQVDVPEGGETYALVVYISDSGTYDYKYGLNHNVSLINNRYAELSVQLIGFNK